MCRSAVIRQSLAVLLGTLAIATARPQAQAPPPHEATAHGRVLACLGQAYALVELIEVASQNLSLLVAELHRPGADAHAELVTGLVFSGTQVEQRQALDVAARLAECTESAAKRATPDAAAFFVALTTQEEVDIALRMVSAYTADYQRSAARLLTYFGESRNPRVRTAPIRGYGRFGDEVKSALDRSRTSLELVLARSRTAAPNRR